MAILGPHVCGALDLGAWSPSLLDFANSGPHTGGSYIPTALTHFYSCLRGCELRGFWAGRQRWVQLTGHCVRLQAPTESLRALFPVSKAEAAAPPGLHTY